MIRKQTRPSPLVVVPQHTHTVVMWCHMTCTAYRHTGSWHKLFFFFFKVVSLVCTLLFKNKFIFGKKKKACAAGIGQSGWFYFSHDFAWWATLDRILLPACFWFIGYYRMFLSFGPPDDLSSMPMNATEERKTLFNSCVPRGGGERLCVCTFLSLIVLY